MGMIKIEHAKFYRHAIFIKIVYVIELGYKRDYDFKAPAYYCKAIWLRECEHIPAIGLSLDRRMLCSVNRVIKDASARSLVCFCCATINTYVEN